jgi:5-methylthioadenosine/S-adenosylhomocysteine deaminase
MTKTLIENGWVIPMTGRGVTWPDGVIAVEDDRIAYAGPKSGLPVGFKAQRRIDAEGKAVLPGLVNTHLHFVGAFNKATTEDAKKEGGNSFRRGILFQEDHVRKEHVYLPGLLHGLEALRTGTTTVNEMWWHQPESARIGVDLGIRAIVGACVREMNTGTIDPGRNERDWIPEVAERDLDDAVALFEEWQGAGDGRVTCRMAPDGPDRMRPETMDRCRELAGKYGLGLHLHCASVPAEQGFMEKAYGKRAVNFLHEHGCLGPGTVLVHCVFVDDEEIALMEETDSRFSHTAYLVGKRAYYPPMDKFYASKVEVSLGTDWMSNDMFKVMRSAILLGRITTGDQALLDAWDALELATMGGARCLNMADEIGSLEAGKKADLILVDMRTPWVAPVRPENVVADLVYNANGSDVTDVMVDGRLVVEGRRHADIDEAELIRDVQKMANTVWADAAPLFVNRPAAE